VDTAAFAAGAHAHAAGKTLLALLGAEERRAHLARYPMVRLTPYTLLDPARLPLLPRQGPHRAPPITQYQEFTLDAVGAAVPVTLGSSLAAVSLSVPTEQAYRLIGLAERLRTAVGREFAAELGF
jgi:DNA-binding IclR family transcriptional regulator